MICQEDDMTFIDICRFKPDETNIKENSHNEWVTLTAQIHSEYNEAYDKTMPILTAIRIEKIRTAKRTIAYFSDFGDINPAPKHTL